METPMKTAIRRTAYFIIGISLGIAAAVALSGCSMAAGAMEGLGVDIRAVGEAAGKGGR
jgi:hypothetical protein